MEGIARVLTIWERFVGIPFNEFLHLLVGHPTFCNKIPISSFYICIDTDCEKSMGTEPRGAFGLRLDA
jgi:hypothetical protein